jgi:hypothetical protein
MENKFMAHLGKKLSIIFMITFFIGFETYFTNILVIHHWLSASDSSPPNSEDEFASQIAILLEYRHYLINASAPQNHLPISDFDGQDRVLDKLYSNELR